MNTPQVLVAGGGPVGLLCAYLLARNGLHVRLFDNNGELQSDPRAATVHPATLEILGEAGLVADMIRVGLISPTYQFWDRPTGRLVAEFDHAVLAQDTAYPFVVQCEQFKTARVILDRLERMDNVEVLFDHDVLEVSQDEGSVSVTVAGPDGTAIHRAPFLVGADGGRSRVRKQVDVGFEGFTWNERFLVLTTPFDFGGHRGYSYRSYFADPEEWCNCFKVAHDGPPGLWRTVFPADPALSEQEILSDASAQARLSKFFPAETPYELVHRNLYTTHQRVAERFRVGRVLLAGDAAHINNPIGGMGLNGGIQDAANLAGKLSEILLGGAPLTRLDLYERQRRSVAVDFVQQQTIANKNRLEARDPELRRKNFEVLAETAGDPERARNFLLASSMIASQRRVAAMTEAA